MAAPEEDPVRAELRELRVRVAILEQRILEMEGRRPPGAPPVPRPPPLASAPVHAPAVAPASAPPAAPAAAKPPQDLETRVGANWVGKVGMLVFVLGIGFFVRYAFENDWIGLAERIWLGVLAGVALVGVSEVLHRRGRTGAYPAILAAGGVVLVYFSVFAAYHFEPYRAATGVTAAVDLVLLALVAAGAVALALRRESPTLAGQAFLLGYVTVFLAENAEQLALPYAVLLAAGLAGVAAWKRWTLVGLGGVAGAYATSALVLARGPDPQLFLVALTVYFLAFLAFSWVTALREPRAGATAALANGALYVLLLLWALEEHVPDRTAFGLLLAGLVHVGLAGVAAARGGTAAPLAVASAAVAVLALALWAPFAVDGAAVTLAWAALLGATLLVAARAPASAARLLPYALAPFVAARVVLYDPNEVDASALRTLGMVAGTAALGSGWRALRRAPEPSMGRVFLAAAVVGALSVLAADLAGVAISIAWAVLGGAFLGAGFAAAEPDLRFAGLGTFGATLVRIFTIDLAEVDVMTRIVSFVFVGALLLAVSYYYSRRGGAGTGGGR